MYRSQKLALRYFTAAAVLFGVMVVAGLLSAIYYIEPNFLFGVFNFNMSKILHINTLLGLGMVYAAILSPGLLEGRIWPMAALAAIVFVLALVSRRRDLQTWQGTTNMVLAAGLFGLGLLQRHPYPYLTFWGLFWIGILVANLALWGAIQRPAAGDEPS